MKVQQTERLSVTAMDLVQLNNFLKEDMAYLRRPLLNPARSLKIALESIMWSLRSMIRAMVSHGDAICLLLRQMVPATKKDELEVVFDGDDSLRLADQKRKDGKFVSYFPDSKSILRFSLEGFARIFAPSFKLDLRRGWNDYLEIIDIRHGLTHPKNFADQIISSDQYATILRADAWITEQISRLLKLNRAENPFMAR